MLSSEMLSMLFDYTTKSFEEVVKEVTEKEIKPTDSFIISSPTIVSAVVGVSGIKGRIILTTTYKDAQSIATAMNFGDPIDDQDEVFMYFAEFANMYCGRTATHMNDKLNSRAIFITPPAIFFADDLRTISPNMVTHKSYYKTDFGDFIIDVGSVEEQEDEFGDF